MIETPVAGEILTTILQNLDPESTCENNRLYLISECGNGNFTLMFHCDGIRLHVIEAELNVEMFSKESLTEAWEQCKDAQKSRVEQQMISNMFRSALRAYRPS